MPARAVVTLELSEKAVPGELQQHQSQTGVTEFFPFQESRLNPTGKEDLYPGIHTQDSHYQNSQASHKVLGLSPFNFLFNARLTFLGY